MKNALIIILTVAAVALATLYIGGQRKITEANADIAALRQKLADAEARTSQEEQQAAALQTRLHETRVKAVAKADEVSHLEQALTNQVQTNAKAANPMAEMFKNPEMKEMIKTQQKVAFSGIIDKSYAPFFSGLQLKPEQAAGLKELITKKMLVDASFGVSLMSGEVDADKRQEMLLKAKTDKDGIDAEIKQFLGEENYPQFQSYEKTIPERMAIGMFKDQLASGSAAITPDQEAQLVQAMTEERQGFKFTTDFYDQSKIGADLASVFTEDKIAQFQQEREQLDQHYFARATNVLAPEQIEPFQKFLTSQREMQNFGLKMGMKMFAPKQGGQ